MVLLISNTNSNMNDRDIFSQIILETRVNDGPASKEYSFPSAKTIKLESFKKRKSENSLLHLLQPTGPSSSRQCTDGSNTEASCSKSLDQILKRNIEVLDIFELSPSSATPQKTQPGTNAAAYVTPRVVNRRILTPSNKRRRITHSRSDSSAVAPFDLSDKKLSLPLLDDLPVMRQPRMRLQRRKTTRAEFDIFETNSTCFISHSPSML